MILASTLIPLPHAYAVDWTLSGDSGRPAYQDPATNRQCGANVSEIAMRAIFQPTTYFAPGKVPPMQIELISDDADGPRMTIVSDRLLKHLKAKKNRLVSVVFTRVNKGLLEKDAVYSLKACLIDSKPVRDWLDTVGE